MKTGTHMFLCVPWVSEDGREKRALYTNVRTLLTYYTLLHKKYDFWPVETQIFEICSNLTANSKPQIINIDSDSRQFCWDFIAFLTLEPKMADMMLELLKIGIEAQKLLSGHAACSRIIRAAFVSNQQPCIDTSRYSSSIVYIGIYRHI